MLPSSVKILFASQTESAELWLPLLRQALPHHEIVTVPEASVDIAIVATPPAGTFQKLGRLKLVQSLWMGVEKLLADPAYPRGVPLAWTRCRRCERTSHLARDRASYSTRSALSGSALAACRAGMTHANIAIAVSNATTMAIVKGSVGVTS